MKKGQIEFEDNKDSKKAAEHYFESLKALREIKKRKENDMNPKL